MTYTRTILALIFACLFVTTMWGQETFTLKADSFLYKDIYRQQPNETVHRPATFTIDRAGSIRFDLPTKGAFTYVYDSISSESEPLTFFGFPIGVLNEIRFFNGDGYVSIGQLIKPGGEKDSVSILVYKCSGLIPWVDAEMDNGSKVFDTIYRLVENKTFLTRKPNIVKGQAQLTASPASQQPSAKIVSTHVEQHCFVNNVPGMKIHVGLEVSGMKGHKTNVLTMFYDADKKSIPAPEADSRYLSADKKLWAWTEVTPQYDNTSFSDVVIFMPYKQFPKRMWGKTHALYYVVFVNGIEKGWLKGNSDYTSFTLKL